MKHSTSYTKGPWTALTSELENGAPDTARIKDSKGKGVCITNHANAQLIASAPELLSEVETLIEVLERGTETPQDLEGILDYAKQVVNKAKGVV